MKTRIGKLFDLMNHILLISVFVVDLIKGEEAEDKDNKYEKAKKALLNI